MNATSEPSLALPIRIPPLEARIVTVAGAAPFQLHRLRFGVRHVEVIFLIDKHAARLRELLPLRQELPLLVEDLGAIISAIGNEQPSLWLSVLLRACLRPSWIVVAKGGALSFFPRHLCAETHDHIVPARGTDKTMLHQTIGEDSSQLPFPNSARTAVAKRTIPANTYRVCPSHCGMGLPPLQFRQRQSFSVAALRKKKIATITKKTAFSRVFTGESPAGNTWIACRKSPVTAKQAPSTKNNFQRRLHEVRL